MLFHISESWFENHNILKKRKMPYSLVVPEINLLSLPVEYYLYSTNSRYPLWSKNKNPKVFSFSFFLNLFLLIFYELAFFFLFVAILPLSRWAKSKP